MNGQFDEELLSAYHDGELPESERQPVADRIADDAGLREVLDEFAELSSSLKSLPRSRAPEDLHGTVMRQVQDAPAVQPKIETPRPSRRMLWFWTAGTAASLLIAVGIIWIAAGPNRHGALQVADMESADDEGGAEQSPGGQFAEAPNVEGSRSAPPALAMDQAILPAEMPAPGEARSLADTADSLANDAQLKVLLRSLSGELEEGQALQVLREVDDELVLVEFLVVDIDETLGDVEVLLNRSGSQALVNPPGGSQSRASAGAAVNRENRLCGIFLDATREDLVAALRKNNLEEHVVVVDAAEADSSVVEAQVEADDGFQEEMSVYNRAMESLREQRRDGPNQDVEPLLDAPGADTRSRFLIVILEEDDTSGN